jgi:hypothetical protein
MASKFTIHNGMESDNVNAAINFTVPVTFGGLGAVTASGAVRFVSPTGVDSGDGKEASAAFLTIQHAIDASAENDVIVVYPGEYDENLVVETNYLTIAGAQTGYGRPDMVATAGVVLTVAAQGFRAFRLRFASQDGSSCVRQEGNGFEYGDCVFDEATDAGAAGLHLKGNDDDDSFTASEGVVTNCLFRGCANGILFAGAETPGNGVGSTHCVIDACRFIDNTAPDIATADNSSVDATYSVQDVIIRDCDFAEPKNKATWIDFTTANGGAASDQTGMIRNCYFNDDTVDTTAIAIVGTGVGVVGCHSMDGEFDGSGLD